MMEQPSFEDQELGPVLDRIMTAQAYSKIEHPTPYVFELKGEGKELYYFGSYHSRDPEDPMLAEIKQAFENVGPDMVFVEGVNVEGDIDRFNEKVRAASPASVVDEMGEPGFTLKLAAEHGVEWRSPEPSDAALYEDLLARGFSREEIFAWAVLLMLPQYNRQQKKTGFESYVRSYIENFKKATAWDGFDYSYGHAMSAGERIVGKSIDAENEPDASDLVDPVPWENKKDVQTSLNRVGEASALIRDRKIVSEIADTLKTHRKLFVVYGSSHAAMQEPALRSLLERAQG